MVEQQSSTESGIRPWIGVAADVFTTLVLLVLGFDPAYEVISRHRQESAFVLGILHMILVPCAILTALVRSEKLKLFANAPGFLYKATESALVFFYVFGWLMPVLMFAQRTNVPAWLIHGCIYAHVAPIVVTVLLALAKRGHWMDSAAQWIAERWGPQAVLYSVYLAGIEVFLIFARSERNRFGPLPFLIWAGAYLPARLLVAQISGLRGPERWTFIATNAHLLVRLLLATND